MNIFFASMGRTSKRPILVIINGESNSGGYALNSEAPLNEIGERESVQILNNNTLVFENLDIGVNNLLGHAGLSNGSTHGFELELANRADVNDFYSEGVYLVKTGAGGSTIAQWNVGGAYYNTMESRITTAQEILNFSDYNIVVLYSLGINDAIAGTNVNVWKTAVQNHLNELRTIIGQGNVPIIMTQFQGMGSGGTQYNSYSTTISEIATNLENVYAVDVSGAGLRDLNHWNYAGMKQVAGDMLTIFENL